MNYKSIGSTEILSDTELNEIEAGACGGGCKRSCYTGKSNNGTIFMVGSYEDLRLEEKVEKVELMR